LALVDSLGKKNNIKRETIIESGRAGLYSKHVGAEGEIENREELCYSEKRTTSAGRVTAVENSPRLKCSKRSWCKARNYLAGVLARPRSFSKRPHRPYCAGRKQKKSAHVWAGLQVQKAFDHKRQDMKKGEGGLEEAGRKNERKG